MALIFAGTGANPGTTQISQIITPGIVIAAYAYTLDPVEDPLILYVTIGVGEVQAGALVQVKAKLAEGYIHRHKSLTWTGFYPLAPNDHFYMTLTGDLTRTVEANLRRLSNIDVKALTELLSGRTLPS